MSDDSKNSQGPATIGRRKIMLAGASLAAAPLFAGAGSAGATTAEPAPLKGPFTVRAYATKGAKSGFAPMHIQRRAVGPKDILIDIEYAGICHSDIHTARSEWSETPYPCVPGHEIVGKVAAIGNQVTHFKIGDYAGVGCMVDSCGECENCLADREQNCLKGTTFTYASPDKVMGGMTYGGYSERIVVKEHFAIRMPAGANLAAMTPLLCAGVTTFSPMQHWQLKPGQRVGVIGMGGLGHVAVKLGVARRAEVTVFTTTFSKLEDAKRMGAHDAVLWSDKAAFARLANHFDLIISTVPESYPTQQFVDLLKLDATFVNVGALEGLDGMLMAFGRKSFAGSLIGGIAETQEVIDYCAARNITADIEMIKPEQIDKAYERVIGKDVRYRFVIDFASARKA
ncbi:hydroxyacid dehydrogenase [Pseudomonas syringae pv. daphniphylli]|uniref:Alcohol dehydrogenase GroES domain-containing protein n=2 Tax=Pseudomonas syringae TaxID=317 RepID=A0A9X0GXA4_PSESX|nr:Alcohol dehydrogenase GroES domain-containing protein [Pseudomonas syringae pv. daphniphylli]KWS83929.1 hydroxyacid dehydrogenase [Pseudomonas syringae pv. daphniphylli]